MSWFRSLGLRAQLALALVALAALAVGLATLISHRGIQPRLTEAALARLDTAAERVAGLGATLYEQSGGWTGKAIHELEHLALLNGLALTLVSSDGTAIARTDPGELGSLERVETSRSAPVVVDGLSVARIVVFPLTGRAFTPEDVRLQDALDRLDLVGAVISAAAALIVAFMLAQMLSHPLRRIREAAQRIAGGDLAARVRVDGSPDIRAVGEALNSLAQTLEREEELRKESVADLAHELRTPVSGLLSRIEAAQDGVFDDGRANLQAMHADALRLTRLLDDISRLAEAERPSLLLDKSEIDLAAVAGSAAALLAWQFAARQISLEEQLEPVAVFGDARRIDQIATNLLSNALRYTPPGGTVSIKVGARASEAFLEVADSGIGIPSQDQARIFERFWRGDPSRSRSTGGAGIGLAIVRELVRAHDGRIEVESVVGVGTRFRVVLAARHGGRPGRQSASSNAAGPTAPART